MTLKEILAALEAGGDAATIGPAITELLAGKIDTTELASVQAKNKDLADQLTHLRDNMKTIPEGFDPKKWDELLKLQTDAEEGQLKSEQRWDELKLNLTAAHQAEIEKRDQRESQLMSALTGHLIESASTSALNTAQGNAALLLPHMKANLKVIEKDGAFQAIVVDPTSGEQRLNMEKNGVPFTISELVAEMQTNDVYASAFRSGNAGGGAAGSGNTGGMNNSVNPWLKGSNGYNKTHQILMMKQNPDLAAQMQKRAETATAASQVKA